MARHILLVDDEVAICEAFKAFLASQGHEVTYATNGAKALNDVLQADLVICDIRLGNEDGLKVVEQLKGVRPELKVLMLTGYPSIDALQTAKDLGVVGFLTKPLPLPELLSNVDKVLGEKMGHVLAFPSSLKEKLADVVPYLGEVSFADPPNWLRVRTQIRAVQPACVLVDGAAPETIDFLDACKRELEGLALFVMCRNEDFNAALQLISRFPSATCMKIDGPADQVLRSIRTQVMARREESDRVRAMLSQQLARCEYAEPLRTGYYCTIPGPCPYGEQKDSLVTVRGKDHHRCPKRPFVIPNADRVGLLVWKGFPDEKAIIDYRAAAMEQVRTGKTHIVINCQVLETAHFNLVEILADVETALADKPEARVDVINLAPKLLHGFRKAGEFLVGVKFHGRVLMELENSRHEALQ